MFSVDTVKKHFLDSFIYDNNLKYKGGDVHDIMKWVSKRGTVNSYSNTLGSTINDLIEINECKKY